MFSRSATTRFHELYASQSDLPQGCRARRTPREAATFPRTRRGPSCLNNHVSMVLGGGRGHPGRKLLSVMRAPYKMNNRRCRQFTERKQPPAYQCCVLPYVWHMEVPQEERSSCFETAWPTCPISSEVNRCF